MDSRVDSTRVVGEAIARAASPPNPLPHRDFMRALRTACGVPGRLLDAGFTFEHPTWPAAARQLAVRRIRPS